jgi:hypothetical protein
MNEEQMIDAARKKSGVSSVRRSSPPPWLKQKIDNAAVKMGMGKAASEPPAMLLRRTLERHGFEGFWDHAGVTKIGQTECFVLEPYMKGDRDEYESFAEHFSAFLSLQLNCNVTPSRVSWHFPGWTYRILFSP